MLNWKFDVGLFFLVLLVDVWGLNLIGCWFVLDLFLEVVIILFVVYVDIGLLFFDLFLLGIGVLKVSMLWIGVCVMGVVFVVGDVGVVGIGFLLILSILWIGECGVYGEEDCICFGELVCGLFLSRVKIFCCFILRVVLMFIGWWLFFCDIVMVVCVIV